MKIDLLDINRLIEVNKLQEVTSQSLHYNRNEFHPDGIMSNEIFGVSKRNRKFTYAYINLGLHFIHPYVYKGLSSIFPGISGIINGNQKYSVNDGQLVKDDNGWTGIESLYANWEKIDWYKKGSSNKNIITILSGKPKNVLFVSRFLVSPPFYRDIKLGTDMDPSEHTNSVNTLYQKLIRIVNIINTSGALFSFQQYAPQSVVQTTINDLYEYYKSRISKKYGLIKRSLMGKSVDYGVRAVISAPDYHHDNFEDSMVDMEHCALPLAQVIVAFKPFVVSYIKNFFTQELINRAEAYVATGSSKLLYVKIHNPEIQFSEKVIDTIINNYVFNPDGRFSVITVDFIDPNNSKKTITVPLYIRGRKIFEDNSSSTKNVLYRHMTVTDLLYLAAVDAAENRHVMVSRYPVGTDKGIFFNKVRVQSTIEHDQVIYNGKEYKFFPRIDVNDTKGNVKTKFVDSLVFSNSYLDGLGGDYDGDQTSIRGLWSDEANNRAESLMNSKLTALNITGSNSRVMSKEVFNTCYELTRLVHSFEKNRVISAKEEQELLGLNIKEINKTKMLDMFSNSANITSDGKVQNRKAPFNPYDEMTIPANFFENQSSQIKTTVGRYIFNRYILEGSGVISVFGYQNQEFGKDGLEKFDTFVGDSYLNDKINRKQFNNYIDRRDTLGLQLNAILARTISPKMAKPLPSVEKRKKELFQQYAKEIEAKDLVTMNKIEKELVTIAKEELKDDPGMDLYNSGDLNFGNNYKNNSILKGPVLNKLTDEYDFVGSSFMNGIEIKDLPAHANSVVAGVYPGSIKTAEAGYMAKKLLAIMQMVEIDEPGTDCGTKRTIPIDLTGGKNGSANALLYKYFKNESGQLEQLTPENVESYIGKTLDFRSPMTCISDKICSKCASELFYKLDTKNIGLHMAYMSHADLNIGLKAKHVSTISLYDIDLDKAVK